MYKNTICVLYTLNIFTYIYYKTGNYRIRTLLYHPIPVSSLGPFMKTSKLFFLRKLKTLYRFCFDILSLNNTKIISQCLYLSS